MPLINPATEEAVAQCPRASVDQLNQAVATAKAAFPAWAATPIEDRRKAISKIADVIEQNSGELARLLTQEEGKPIADATVEVMAWRDLSATSPRLIWLCASLRIEPDARWKRIGVP